MVVIVVKIMVMVVAKVMIVVVMKPVIDKYLPIKRGVAVGTIVITRHAPQIAVIGWSLVRHRGTATQHKHRNNPA